MVTIDIEYLSISLPKKQRNQVNDICIQNAFFCIFEIVFIFINSNIFMQKYKQIKKQALVKFHENNQVCVIKNRSKIYKKH